MSTISNTFVALACVVLVSFLPCPTSTFGDEGYLDEEDNFMFSAGNLTSHTRFLIYDVNSGEGFNLRRDVYIRAANLVKYLNDRGEDWILVLPPWRHLYHWKSENIEQEALPWREFFDLENMNRYVPVMEFEDFMKYLGYNGIDHLLYLQRHPEGFKNGWKELVEIARCIDGFTYWMDRNNFFRGYFWNLKDVFAKKYDCVSVQGHATILADFLKDLPAKSVFFDRFEQVLHIEYGSLEFFKARRSLVFARHLRDAANKFRMKSLQSNDEDDGTHYEEDWREQVPLDGHSKGGPYIGVHMRRGDFTHAHKETVPTIAEIAEEVVKALKKYKLRKLYVSTDGTQAEIDELRNLTKAQIHRFPRTKRILKDYKDGGIAIIDQWIVAHARYFIGTCESTFSFRIHEERDILGFGEDTTYNCVCGKQSPKDRCHQPTKWRVKF